MKARTNGEIASDLVPDEQARAQKVAGQKLDKFKSLTTSLVSQLNSAMQTLNEIDGLTMFVEEELGNEMNFYFTGTEPFNAVITNLDTNLRNSVALAKELEEGLS